MKIPRGMLIGLTAFACFGLVVLPASANAAEKPADEAVAPENAAEQTLREGQIRVGEGAPRHCLDRLLPERQAVAPVAIAVDGQQHEAAG